MSIYLISSKKNDYLFNLFYKLNRNFQLSNFYSKVLVLEKESNYIDYILQESDDLDNIIIISDYNILDTELFELDLDIFFLLYNLPDEYLEYNNFFNMDYPDISKIKTYTKINNSFYIDETKKNIMILWGTSYTTKELIQKNYIYFKHNNEISNKEIYTNDFNDYTILNNIKITLKKKVIKKNYKSLEKLEDKTIIYLVQNHYLDDIFDLMATNNNVISNSLIAREIFKDNFCYIDNYDNFVTKFLFDKKKKMNINNIIYKDFMMHKQCYNLMDYIMKNIFVTKDLIFHNNV